MELVITFFRDILDGNTYIVIVVIASILICSCIGYMAEISGNKKKEKEKYVNVAPVTNSVAVPVEKANSVVVPSVSATQTPVNGPVAVQANPTFVQPVTKIDSAGEVQTPVPNPVQQGQ